ncbi:hypothetical protein H310_03707 [Aphanomyces invadans]|uniref:Low temperature requirement protein LtrA n=1 Tax=Aphanomyces invadans TaxID=157072 RepID=A0A024UIU4_9STRA|nr:hypothetical protein H310_03707 [Aphanomyces invadans]ETW06115.1 hypothetical protein H310_03707 [Aphanomyces invadans]|eukprot:XP_008865892.1 hypothetical protein H310_03707 [Aphanomyces invadans]
MKEGNVIAVQVKPRERSLGSARRTSSARGGAPQSSGIPWLGGRITIYAPMKMRDPHEPHRVSSALEKLFDLTLVVALSAVSTEFATNIQHGGDKAESFMAFLVSFFTIWNTWFPYVWFATTYDVDDVLYRVGTFGEMIGIFMISDGIAHNFAEVVVGYIVLRFFHGVFFRLRAAYEDPDRRAVNVKHSALSTFIMACWYIQQTYSTTYASQVVGFAILACCDLAYPYIAQRTTAAAGRTRYHAHHVSDRYNEFTTIVVGETMLSLAHATVLKADAFNTEAVSTCVASMVLLFVLWWIYSIVPFGQILHDQPNLTYVVAYGHFFIHAPLAAFASGIYIMGLATQAGAPDGHRRRLEATSSPTTAADGISVATAAFVISISTSILLIAIPVLLSLPVHVVLRNATVCVAMNVIAATAPHHVSVSTLMWLFCTPMVALLVHILVNHRNAQPKQRTPPSGTVVAVDG